MTVPPGWGGTVVPWGGMDMGGEGKIEWLQKYFTETSDWLGKKHCFQKLEMVYAYGVHTICTSACASQVQAWQLPAA